LIFNRFRRFRFPITGGFPDFVQGDKAVTEEPFVSADILGNTHSSIIDGTLTRNIGNLLKVVTWYDNEVGISNRLAELAVELAVWGAFWCRNGFF